MHTEMAVSMIVTAWRGQNKRLDDLIAAFNDEQWQKETAPGRNTGTYLLGHLAAVNDNLIKLLGFGERLHPELEEIFLKNADRSGLPRPTLDQLKSYWKEINAALDTHINQMQPADWFTAHTAVSPEDFAREPHRNKLNVLIGRSIHQGYHLGQLMYLK